MRVGTAVLVLMLAGCMGSEMSDPLASGGVTIGIEANIGAMGLPVASIDEPDTLDSLDCHFGKPLEMDEYNGLVYLYGGRPGPSGGQVVDMWLRIPEIIELPDDISWTCNPEEFEHSTTLALELAQHNEFPNDVLEFNLERIAVDPVEFIGRWHLIYQVPVLDDDLRGNWKKRMVLKLWDTGRLIEPLLDSVPVTVTACLHPHPLVKHACIDAIENGGD
ncbi:MAG: hypothetical protein OXG18_00565 [Gemmatimonadetes bacterium]|nr:hypothetical protein [Gemmatimonadota bacterium]